MGKNLKGKECGKGIYQRKDGLYSAKNWLADARYEERHNLIATYTNCVMKRVSNAFVCMPYDILMLHARLSVAYSLKCCNSY